MTSGKTNLSLYEQAKAGLKSLFIQMAQVSLGLTVMLVATGGNPPGWMISASFILGIGFVAWSENKRQSELQLMKKKIGKVFLLTEKVNNLRQLAKSFDNTIDLSGIDISAIKLSNVSYFYSPKYFKVDLSKINLSRAKLAKAKLNQVQLIGANLSGADLSGANLSGANLSGANLSGANLSGANLSGANLSKANLSKANLSDAKVEYAKFKNTLGINKELQQNLSKKGADFASTWLQTLRIIHLILIIIVLFPLTILFPLIIRVFPLSPIIFNTELSIGSRIRNYKQAT